MFVWTYQIFCNDHCNSDIYYLQSIVIHFKYEFTYNYNFFHKCHVWLITTLCRLAYLQKYILFLKPSYMSANSVKYSSLQVYRCWMITYLVGRHVQFIVAEDHRFYSHLLSTFSRCGCLWNITILQAKI